MQKSSILHRYKDACIIRKEAHIVRPVTPILGRAMVILGIITIPFIGFGWLFDVMNSMHFLYYYMTTCVIGTFVLLRYQYEWQRQQEYGISYNIWIVVLIELLPILAIWTTVNGLFFVLLYNVLFTTEMLVIYVGIGLVLSGAYQYTKIVIYENRPDRYKPNFFGPTILLAVVMGLLIHQVVPIWVPQYMYLVAVSITALFVLGRTIFHRQYNDEEFVPAKRLESVLLTVIALVLIVQSGLYEPRDQHLYPYIRRVPAIDAVVLDDLPANDRKITEYNGFLGINLEYSYNDNTLLYDNDMNEIHVEQENVLFPFNDGLAYLDIEESTDSLGYQMYVSTVYELDGDDVIKRMTIETSYRINSRSIIMFEHDDELYFTEQYRSDDGKVTYIAWLSRDNHPQHSSYSEDAYIHMADDRPNLGNTVLVDSDDLMIVSHDNEIFIFDENEVWMRLNDIMYSNGYIMKLADPNINIQRDTHNMYLIYTVEGYLNNQREAVLYTPYFIYGFERLEDGYAILSQQESGRRYVVEHYTNELTFIDEFHIYSDMLTPYSPIVGLDVYYKPEPNVILYDDHTLIYDPTEEVLMKVDYNQMSTEHIVRYETYVSLPVTVSVGLFLFVRCSEERRYLGGGLA